MDKKNILFQVPATITKLTSMAHGSVRVQVDTQENLNHEEISKLWLLKDNLGWFNMVCREKDTKIKPDDLIDLPEIKEVETDIKKSTSERLRNVLYVYFTKSGNKPEDFETGS